VPQDDARPPDPTRGTAGGHHARSAAGHHDVSDPEAEALLADSIGPALMVVLDTLGRAERLAFVLHTSSPCRSTRSPSSSNAPRPRPASSPAAPAGGSRGATSPPNTDPGRQRQIVEAFLAAPDDSAGLPGGGGLIRRQAGTTLTNLMIQGDAKIKSIEAAVLTDLVTKSERDKDHPQEPPTTPQV